jgi:outer membrane protein
MTHSRLTWCRNAAAVSCLLLWLPTAGMAQGKEPLSPEEKRGNSFERLFLNDYTVPQVRSFELAGEDPLDALIKDGKLALSDEDAIRLALQNNVDINVERYTPYFTLWEIERGRAVLNPSLAFSTNVDRLVTPATSALEGSKAQLSLNTTYDLTYHKPFEPGLDLDVNFSTLRNRTSTYFINVNPSLAPNLGFKLTQHLLKDFGRTTRGRMVHIARNNLSISEESFIARTNDIITGVLNTYWDLVYAEEDIKVKEASRKLAELVLGQNKIQAEVGTMAPLDVIQAEAEVAARTEALVVARYTRKTTEDQLKKLISSRTDPGAIPASLVTLSRPEAPPPPAHTVQDAIQRAISSRPEVKQILKDQENKKIQLNFTKNQLKPTLDLVAGYSQNGLGGDLIVRDYSQGFFNAPIVLLQQGGFWDSMDSLFSRKYLGYALGITLRVPIGNSDARASSAQAQIDFRQGEEKLRSQQQKVALEIRQAYDNIAMNRERVSTAEVTVRYQQQRLQGEQDKYALGATTTRFILEAQRDLQDAQSRLLKAKIDLIKSRITLDKALGDTLQAHNIRVEEALRPFQ